MRRALVLALVAAVGFGTIPARAQSAADLETARLLFAQGNELHDHGDLAGALAKYRAADALAHTPVTALELGKTLAELGRLVDARAALLSVAAIPVKPNESAKTAFARSESAKLATQILPRIPSLTVTFEGAPPGSRLELHIDGVAMDPQTIGQPRVLDPGAHAIVASVEGGPGTIANVTLAEGEARSISVHVDPPPAAVPPHVDSPPLPPPPVKPVEPPPPPPPVPPPPSRGLDTGLAVALSLGGAGLVSFVIMGVTGALAQTKVATVQAHCDETHCDTVGLDAASSGRALATTANVTLALGSAFAVSSLVVGLVTRRRSAPAAALSVAPVAGGASAYLSVTFR